MEGRRRGNLPLQTGGLKSRGERGSAMKLKPDFITQDVDDVQFMVPLGTETFSGVVRSNRTAAFIINQLKQETTEEQIIDALWNAYDAPRERIAGDVHDILSFLRGIHALEED